jgi:uncharacterized membrane protein YuzA (DUF378 family)
MNWGEIIFMLLALAGVFVLLIVIKNIKSEKQSADNKAPPKRGQ